jgi:OOP family OmpA-OmpF porin
MKKIILMISLGLSLATTSAFATHDSGVYIEGNIGTNYTGIDAFGDTFSSNGGVGVNTNLGYQFNRYLAAEVGYTYYGINEGFSGLDAAAKLILPLHERFYAFGKLGVAVYSDGSETLTLPFGGIGVAYQVTPALDFNIQAQGSNFLYQIGLISAGVTYHFS